MRQQIVSVVAGLLAAVAAHAAEPRFSVEQLQQDMRFIRHAIGEIHPDPGFSVTAPQLEAALDKAGQQLSVPMSRDEAWLTLGRLNPVFADAHFGVLQPDWRTQAQAHLAGGGALFPFEMQVTPDGGLFIRAALGGGASALAGTRVDSIDGVPAARLVEELLQRVHGDTPAFRAEVLSRRFWMYYWKTLGAPARYTIAYRGERLEVPASTARPAALVGSQAADFDRVFSFELLGGGAALLTINQFGWPDKDRFYAFTADAFARMRAAGTTSLIIDVRENPGGDDDMWKLGVLPYIATKPYQHTSAYVKKVLPGRAGEGERVGEVLRGKYDKWEQPEPNHPLRFPGQVYVLVGGMTYSSAVLFSNVMQDFGFAKLVGTGGYARARQSGNLQSRILPNTGLELVVPRFVLDRPAGAGAPVMVQPDIALPDDPFNRRALVDALVRRIGQQAAATAAR